MKKINIEVNETQSNVIREALDFYSRFLMGQFRQIDSLMVNHSDFWEDWNKRERLEEIIREMRDIIYPELNGCDSWGIYNIKCPRESKIAYDIIQVLRHELWKSKEEKTRYTNDAYPPLIASHEDLCKVRVENERNDE